MTPPTETAAAVSETVAPVAEAPPHPVVEFWRYFSVNRGPVIGLVVIVVLSSPALADLLLIRQSRLSVMPVTKAQFDAIVKLGGGLERVHSSDGLLVRGEKRVDRRDGVPGVHARGGAPLRRLADARGMDGRHTLGVICILFGCTAFLWLL